MPATLKRKRSAPAERPVHNDSAESEPSRSSSPALDPMEVLRRHFESQYEPLEIKPVRGASESSGEEEWSGQEDGDEEWDGFSGISDEDEAAREKEPEVVVFDGGRKPRGDDAAAIVGRSEKRKFMSSKPPSLGDSKPAPKPARTEDADSDSGDEAANMRNDAALQKLLRESHLLDGDSDSLELSGKKRLQALQERMRDLAPSKKAAKAPVEKMPMHMRKGIEGAKKGREKARRADAKESGVVLEKEKRERKSVHRDRGLVGSVGKFRGGALVLSKKDVADIQGTSTGGGGRKGKTKRRK